MSWRGIFRKAGITITGRNGVLNYKNSIRLSGSMAKGLEATDATMTQSWNNGFFVCGSGNGSDGDQHSVTVTDHYIPIQVNMVSIANPAAAKHFTAAMFRCDVSTADQSYTLCNPIAVRANIAKNIYGGSGINVDMSVTEAISIGGESLKAGYFAVSGDGAITCTGDCNVLEAVYKQTSGGSGMDNVAQFHCNATGCSIADLLHLRNVAGTVTNGLHISGALTNGINISGICEDGIEISGANTGHHINITGTWGQGITGAAIGIGDYSTAIAFGTSTDHVIGIVCHASSALGTDDNAIMVLGKFTTTGDCSTGTVAQCVLGQGVCSYNIADMYGVRGSIAISGAPEVNQIFGVYATLTTTGCNMAATGNIAGMAVLISGTADITQTGSPAYGKVSGIFVAWKESNAMTVDTCGIYVANFASMLLDSGVRVNHAGTTVNAFHSYLAGGTITTGLRMEGAHTNAFAFPAVGTAPCETYTTEEAPTGKIKILVGTEVRYLAYWD